MIKPAVIIPVRYASSRFPAKALQPINGKPLIVRVIERIKGANVSEIIIATDSEEIRKAVTDQIDCRVEMTSKEHACGTDRIAEVAARIKADYVLNVQGDELVSGPEMINEIVSQITTSLRLATLYTDLTAQAELTDRNVVKLVVNKQGNVLYLSRSAIPFDKNGSGNIKYFKQVGIYIFKREDLIEFSKMKQTDLEQAEGIEMLRALDNGNQIKGIYTNKMTADINVPDDITEAEKLVRDLPIS